MSEPVLLGRVFMSESGSGLAAGGMVRVLTRRPQSSPLYGWLRHLEWPWEAVETLDPSWLPPRNTDLLVTHQHYTPEAVQILQRTLRETEVPVLILADGILEFRNTWQNPSLVPGTLFRPALGHKIACLGLRQAELLERWGNRGKCEVVGLPRLDPWLENPAPPPPAEGPARILVMTARQWAFTPNQREVVLQSLLDLRDELAGLAERAERPIELVWRLTGDLPERLGVTNWSESGGPSELREQLLASTAVVTTYSTTLLEAALAQRPVAVLDYHGVPNYVTPAWTISHRDAVKPVLQELLDPPPAQWEFQQAMLNEQLACDSPALGRMLTLVQTLAETGRRVREGGEPLQVPSEILPRPDRGTLEPSGLVAIDETWRAQIAPPELPERLAVAQFYEFRQRLEAAQSQVRQLQREIEHLEQIADKRESRIADQQQRLEQWRADRESLREALQEIRGRLQLAESRWRMQEKSAQRSLRKGRRRDDRVLRLESLLVSSQQQLEGLQRRILEYERPKSFRDRLRSLWGFD